MSLVDTMKNDFVDASYRTAASQTVEIVKKGLLKVIENQSKGSRKKANVSALRDFLDTSLGNSAISYVLGMAIDQIPGLKEDKRMQRLAKEFRINGMATAGNFVADKFIAQMMPALTGAMQNLPMVQEAKEKAHHAKIEELLKQVDLPSSKK